MHQLLFKVFLCDRMYSASNTDIKFWCKFQDAEEGTSVSRNIGKFAWIKNVEATKVVSSLDEFKEGIKVGDVESNSRLVYDSLRG